MSRFYIFFIYDTLLKGIEQMMMFAQNSTPGELGNCETIK